MSVITILMTMVSTALIYSAPLIFTALGGTFSERGGIVNVGLEGIMIVGAFSGAVFNLTYGPALGAVTPWIGLLVAGGFGLLFSVLHALATVNFRADHIVSGTVLNMLAPALCVFLTKIFYDGKGQTPVLDQSLSTFTFPILSKIPVVGEIFFTRTSLLAYLGILIGFISWWILTKTKFGLRLRSVGENPQAADTLGINVYLMRYSGVLISGFLGGIGGGIMSQSISLNFSVSTIAGQGFMALAAMIFGKWHPLKVVAAAIFFGISQSLAIIGAYIPIISKIDDVWFQMAPYLITIVVLALFIGKFYAPAADGETYVKSK